MSVARSFVIGDVHGCLEELERLLDAIEPTTADTVCFLGDYVDRGPTPRGVIDRLIRLAREVPNCVFLKGNHEDMFLSFLGEPGRHGDAFLWNGGDATLASYGLSGATGPEVAALLPPAHREFLRALRTHAYVAGFLCVHAGVRPTRPLAQQSEEDLLWIREDFLRVPHPFPYTVLFGHTPHRDVWLDLPCKIGLDTGVVYGNLLSCLEIESRQVWQVGRGALAVRRRPLVAAPPAVGAAPS
jgi:serine/threonine protein phosphatase 1